MHVLLTGITSFLGGHLVQPLLQAGHRVTATYRTEAASSARPFPHHAALETRRIDLAADDQYVALPGEVDAVVHVAALATMPTVDTDALLISNVQATRNLVKYALTAGARRFVYASSLSVYGRIAASPVTSTTPIADPDIYGATKYLGERLISDVADRLPAVALRLPGVLGKGAHRAWIPTLLERIKAGQQISIFNPDAPFNNAAHVDDIGRLVLRLLQAELTGFHAVPLGAAGEVAIRDVPDILMAAAGRTVPVAVRPAAQPAFTVSSEEAISRFGYEPMNIRSMLQKYAGP